ncbi:MAG: type II toxin-antitoxin system RelE/ParE family toxin [Deltaproteobacteria bacterium]|nr:type II toxin-antitoxin system RelE/ParE family toxin [Deltaproteobacteria bacterium]
MAAYRVFFKESVWKDFNSIPKKDLKKIIKRIELLSENPRPPGCEKLTGKDRYRLRQGRYRIVYAIRDDKLSIWGVM